MGMMGRTQGMRFMTRPTSIARPIGVSQSEEEMAEVSAGAAWSAWAAAMMEGSWAKTSG